MRFLLQLILIAFASTVVHADLKAGETKAQLCLLCHKPNNPYVPTLQGQTREYLYLHIKGYKEKKRRAEPVMQTNVATLSDRDMRDIADYFASRKPIPGTFSLDAGKVARGKAKAEELKCPTCHMLDFSGKKEVPRLAGVDPHYTELQIVAFTAGKRPHPPVDGLSGLSGEDAESLAQFLAHLQ